MNTFRSSAGHVPGPGGVDLLRATERATEAWDYRLTFDFDPRTRLIFGDGVSDELGTRARELGFRRTLLVADPGLVAVGQIDRAVELLEQAGVTVFPFHAFGSNPDSHMIEGGRAFAAPLDIDSLVA